MRARRGWAWPLVPLYAAGLMVKDELRRAGVLPTRRLKWPVVSVGSLSAGGAGKTPVVIALAGLLRERGRVVDVLSRGYGRAGRGVERVDAEAEGAAERFGDEPVVIARRAGVPVWVGKERYAAGVAAEAAVESEGGRLLPQTTPHPSAENAEGWATRVGGDARVHLLDDGFQHGGLARAVDVVVVTEADLEDALLPAGNLREGLGALRRADVVVIRDEERERVEARVRGLMRPEAAVWCVQRELRVPARAGAGLRPVAFCGLARPEGFWAMLEEAGCGVVEKAGFGDHHRYGMDDVEWIVATARGCGATGVLTTEKDAVKLSRPMLERLRTIGPVCVVGLDARFVDEADVMRELEALIR